MSDSIAGVFADRGSVVSSLNKLTGAFGSVLRAAGFKGTRYTYHRQVGGVWHVVNIQLGAYGRSYYFVNLGIHPVDLPQLVTGALEVLARPKEYQCIFRARVDSVFPNAPFLPPNRGQCEVTDDSGTRRMTEGLVSHVIPWFDRVGTLEYLEKHAAVELSPWLSVVPVIQPKALAMLRFYLARKLLRPNATDLLAQYRATASGEYQFPEVDNYLEGLSAE
jgi:hypothetical protein